jgi:hypothetical protein
MYSSFQEMIEEQGISKNSNEYYFLLARENKRNRKKRSIKEKIKVKLSNKKTQKIIIVQEKSDKSSKGDYNSWEAKNFHTPEEAIPGVKLFHEELENLSHQGKNRCGYLREPHWLDEKYTGLCALTEYFDLCKYPRVIDRTGKNDCPLENQFHKEACAKYQAQLKKEARKKENKYPKKEYFADSNQETLEETRILREIKKVDSSQIDYFHTSKKKKGNKGFYFQK